MPSLSLTKSITAARHKTAARAGRMSMEWIKLSSKNPPEGMVVETKIDDEKGIRNETRLKMVGNLFFFEDGSMYVYYTPTHWKPVSETSTINQ